MSAVSISIWFACKKCTILFENVVDVIQHKQACHFEEFKNTKTIIFEEKPYLRDSEHSYSFPDSTGPETLDEINEQADETGTCIGIGISATAQPEHPCISLSAETVSRTSLNLENEECSEENETGCCTDDDLLDFKPEIELNVLDIQFNENKSRRDENKRLLKAPQEKHNPYPLLKRLTWTEIRKLSRPCHPNKNRLKSGDNGIKSAANRNGISRNIRGPYQKRKPRAKCEICSMEFLQVRKLQVHLESHKKLADRIKPHGCSLCGKHFQYSKLLRNHIKTHSIETPFKCPQPDCEKAFKFARNLQLHQAAHSDLKSFRCPVPNCGKYFKYSRCVTEHLKIHDGKRPFQCTEDPGNCKKACLTNRLLRNHIKNRHSGQKNKRKVLNTAAAGSSASVPVPVPVPVPLDELYSKKYANLRTTFTTPHYLADFF